MLFRSHCHSPPAGTLWHSGHGGGLDAIIAQLLLGQAGLCEVAIQASAVCFSAAPPLAPRSGSDARGLAAGLTDRAFGLAAVLAVYAKAAVEISKAASRLRHCCNAPQKIGLVRSYLPVSIIEAQQF